MPEYLSPGVYVVEVAASPRPIEGVSASTASLVGAELIEELRRLVNQIPPVGTESGGNNSGSALVELVAWISDILARRGDQLGNETYLPSTRLAAAALALVTKNRAQSDTSVLRRVRFFEGQLLEDDDLNVELDYMRSKRQRKVVFGIVNGLQVTVQDDGSGAAVVVSPGCALDNRGRKIVLGTPITLSLPDAVKRVSVIARPTGRFAVLPSLECEFLIVDEPNDDDLTVRYLEKSLQGWRVLNGKNC
jgi:hypothetical protein